MSSMTVVYEGDLKCKATHDETGASVLTVGPKESGGDMSTFSPTDLVGAGLGACVLTTIGIWAKKREIDVSGAKVNVTKEMSSDAPRRIGRLAAILSVPPTVPPQSRESLERTAGMCAVKKSLSPDVEVELRFVYE